MAAVWLWSAPCCEPCARDLSKWQRARGRNRTGAQHSCAAAHGTCRRLAKAMPSRLCSADRAADDASCRVRPAGSTAAHLCARRPARDCWRGGLLEHTSKWHAARIGRKLSAAGAPRPLADETHHERRSSHACTSNVTCPAPAPTPGRTADAPIRRVSSAHRPRPTPPSPHPLVQDRRPLRVRPVRMELLSLQQMSPTLIVLLRPCLPRHPGLI